MARRWRQRARPPRAPRSRTAAEGNAGSSFGLTPFERALQRAHAGRLDAAEAILATCEGSDDVLWLFAYIDAARGRFARALALAWPLASTSHDRDVRRAASVTTGSILRQTGRHAAARAHDRRALRLATTNSDRAHAEIGLAADAVGLGDARSCARWLAKAAAHASRGDDRLKVRLAWVRAEHALLTRRAPAAVRFAGSSVERSRDAGLARHEAKSLLFLGAALEACGDRSARAPLRRAIVKAARIGAEPIERAARALLDRLPPL